MTLDADLAAVRAVARQMRTTTRPLDPRRLSALAASLDHSARGLGRGVEFLRAEAEGRKPPSVEVGDPQPYRGLDLNQAARLLAERVLTATSGQVPTEDDRDVVGSEVDAFVTAIAASGRRTAPIARGVSREHPGADGPGKVRSGARETSKGAAVLAEPRTGTGRRAILDAVAAVARDVQTVGLTDVEVQRATGLSPNTARPRRVELVDGGWLADSGVTREHFGREHTVWILSDKGARFLAAHARTGEPARG